MSDQWYYRTLGQEFGPVTQDTLRNLVESGILSAGDQFRCGAGVWISLELQGRVTAETFPSADQSASDSVDCASAGASTGDAAETGPAATRRSPPCSTAVRQVLAECREYLAVRDSRQATNQIRVHRITAPSIPPLLRAWARIPIEIMHQGIEFLAAAATSTALFALGIARCRRMWSLGAALIAIAIIVAVAQARTFDRRTHVFLTETVAELKRLRAGDADRGTWERFTQRAEAELAQLTPQLEARAGTDKPASMEYLWLARDYLPRMLVDARNTPSDAERKFEIHWQRIEVALQRQPTLNRWPSDPVVLSVSLGGLALLLAAALHWRTYNWRTSSLADRTLSRNSAASIR